MRMDFNLPSTAHSRLSTKKKEEEEEEEEVEGKARCWFFTSIQARGP